MMEDGTMSSLRLRPPELADEAEFLCAHTIMAEEKWEFGLRFDPSGSWSEFVGDIRNRRYGIGLPDGWVPETFLIAVVDGIIVGRLSVRHSLSAFLLQQGGHIGYGVLPAHRRKGYATEILRQGLIIARSLGIITVLVTCDDNNVASSKTIEHHGGLPDAPYVPADGSIPTRRYWIT
jgi:predicted acetyltransferase